MEKLIEFYAHAYHINRLRRFVREIENLNDPELLAQAKTIVEMIEKRSSDDRFFP